MAGTYFDFPNTPITNDITLKAKWCCAGGGEPEFDFKGDWFEVTLTDGTKWHPKTQNVAYNFVLSGQHNVGTLFNDSETSRYVKTAEVKKIEFGKGWDDFVISKGPLTSICCYNNLDRWDNLAYIGGCPEGLGNSITVANDEHIPLSIGAAIYGGSSTVSEVEWNFKFPRSMMRVSSFTLTHFDLSYGYNDGRQLFGKLYFDFSPYEINNDFPSYKVNKLFLMCGGLSQYQCEGSEYIGNYAAWAKGFGLGGPYADEWLAYLPPVTTCSTYTYGGYTNYYKRNTYKI